MNRPENLLLTAAAPQDAVLQTASPQADAGQTAVAPGWAQRNQRWLAQRLAQWRERLVARAAGAAMAPSGPDPAPSDHDFEPALARIARLFGLSAFESELLLLAAGIEIDPALRDALAAAQGHASGAALRLNFALALELLPESHWDALSPLRPHG